MLEVIDDGRGIDVDRLIERSDALINNAGASKVVPVMEITAGRAAETVAVPVSVRRAPRTDVSVSSTDTSEVSEATPRRSAIIVGSTPPAPSVDWFPAMTRSNGPRAMVAARTSAVRPRSAPRSRSSATCTADAAPMASAFRTDVTAFCDAMVSVVTSAPG